MPNTLITCERGHNTHVYRCALGAAMPRRGLGEENILYFSSFCLVFFFAYHDRDRLRFLFFSHLYDT